MTRAFSNVTKPPPIMASSSGRTRRFLAGSDGRYWTRTSDPYECERRLGAPRPGELRLSRAFFASAPPPFSRPPLPFATLRDTIGTQSRGLTAASVTIYSPAT